MALKTTEKDAQARWHQRGRKLAQEAWQKGGKVLAAVPSDPERGNMTEAEWHAYRGGYRGELHVLNLNAELAHKVDRKERADAALVACAREATYFQNIGLVGGGQS